MTPEEKTVKDPRAESSKHRKQLVRRPCLACSRNLKKKQKNKKTKTLVSEANSSKGKHERRECGGTRQRIDNTDS